MADILFIAVLSCLAAAVLSWGFRVLPDERWQVMAAVPREKAGDSWTGLNLTYYGFIMATSTLVALAIMCILLASIAVPLSSILVMILIVLAVCFPAAKVLAFLVEGKRNTLTVGGASFIGIVMSPWVILLVSRLQVFSGITDIPMPVFPVLASISIAYSFGEGFGRLSCISFGCCYGKPVQSCHPVLQRVFRDHAFVFTGKTKKISYAHGLDGQKVIPVQAVTSVILTFSGIVGTGLFLSGLYQEAFLATLTVSQGWRFLSEFLRADYRGGTRISVYQIMGLAAVMYSWAMCLVLPAAAAPDTDIVSGIASLWSPAAILALQSIWLAVFLYTGKSTVTGSSITMHVREKEI